jgi:hypothetical protein
MLMVAEFADEVSREDLDLLFEDLEETSCEEVLAFDDNAKVVFSVPDEIPDPDFPGTIEEYWMGVMNDSKCPCCYPAQDACAVYEVLPLDEFRKRSNQDNNGHGPYEDLLKDLKD